LEQLEKLRREGAAALVEAGRQLHARGWVPATSGNLSVRLDEAHIGITVSGRHKGTLAVEDIMVVDMDGNSLDGRRPSAETLLHTQIYRRFPEAGAVLHTHSVNATLLSRLADEEVVLEGYELLKAFEGIATHEARLVVPVFPNDQNIARLAGEVAKRLEGVEPVCAYLIAGHGVYSWGRSVDDALRHLEALEFLFECELLHRRLAAPG
jgi:methylthioribulose-1-phosphate dehydratase